MREKKGYKMAYGYRRAAELTEAEKRAAWAENQHKAQIMNHKEAKMPLAKLKAKISKELMIKTTYDSNWLVSEHGLHTGQSDNGPWVSKSYDVSFCSWPMGGSAYDDYRHLRTRSITHVVTIPLRDYWTLALQGKGI